MSRLLLLLLGFLSLAVDEQDPDPPEGGEPEGAAGPEGDDLDSLESILEEPEPPRAAPRKDPRDDPYVQRLEQELAEARRARPAPAPVQTTDAEYEREEQTLRNLRQNGADEATLYWATNKIQTDRELRALKAETRQTRSVSEDLADRASFERLEITKPKLYAKYAKRVEEARSTYPGAPRAAILRLLIGDDAMNGTIKPKVAPKPAAPEGNRVDRGRSPGTRSDVRPRNAGTMNDREKRMARLRDRTI